MIQKNNLNYNDVINKLYNKKTITLTFQVTEDCNLNCSYCYQHNKTHNKMDFETAKQMIDLILTNSEKVLNYINPDDKQAVILDFIGGEPFLEVDLIDQIISYFVKKAIELNHPWILFYKVSISSNGILYFTPKVQDFIQKHKNHLSLSITLDGNKELHDMCRRDFNNNPTYDIVVKAVQDYKTKYNNNLSTKLTISPENINYLFEGIKNFITLGFTHPLLISL